jgi:hypothetical protein
MPFVVDDDGSFMTSSTIIIQQMVKDWTSFHFTNILIFSNKISID